MRETSTVDITNMYIYHKFKIPKVPPPVSIATRDKTTTANHYTKNIVLSSREGQVKIEPRAYE